MESGIYKFHVTGCPPVPVGQASYKLQVARYKLKGKSKRNKIEFEVLKNGDVS